jgi:hypothetical protein
MKLLTSLMFLVGYLTLVGCSSTRVDASWKLTDYRVPPHAKALVIAVAPKAESRRAFENRLTSSLETKGVVALPSFPLMDDVTQVSKDKLRPILVQNSIDVVIISSVKAIESSQTYQPPQAIGPQDSLYRNFDTYQVYSSSGQHETGTYSEHIEYLLETNLFDTRSEKLSWSITTRTRESRSFKTRIDNLVDTLIKQGEKDGVF